MAFTTQKDFFNLPFMTEGFEMRTQEGCVKVKSYESTDDTRAWSTDETKQSKFLSDLVTLEYPDNPDHVEMKSDSNISKNKGVQRQHCTDSDCFAPNEQINLEVGGDGLPECPNYYLTEYRKALKMNTILEKQLEMLKDCLESANDKNRKIREILASKLDSNTAKYFYNRIQKFTAAGKFNKCEENAMLQIYQKMQNMHMDYEILQAENNNLQHLVEKLAGRVTLEEITVKAEQSEDVDYLQSEINCLRKECIFLRQVEDDYWRLKQNSANTKAKIFEQQTKNINMIIKERDSLREECKLLKTLQRREEMLEQKMQLAETEAIDLNASLTKKTQYISEIEMEMQHMQKYYGEKYRKACLREEYLKAQIEDMKKEIIEAQCEARKRDTLAMKVSCLRNEVLKRDLSLKEYDCQYKQLMDVVCELRSVKLQCLHDTETQTCAENSDELIFYTRATLNEIRKELKKRGYLDPGAGRTNGKYDKQCGEEVVRLQQEIDEMRKEMQKVEEMKKHMEEVDRVQKEMQEADNNDNSYEKQCGEEVVRLQQEIDEMRKEMQKVEEMKKHMEEVDRVQQEMQEADNNENSYEKQCGEEVVRLQQEIDEMRKEMQKVEEMKKHMEEVDRVQKEMQEADSNDNSYEKQCGEEVVRLQQEIDEMRKEMQKVEEMKKHMEEVYRVQQEMQEADNKGNSNEMEKEVQDTRNCEILYANSLSRLQELESENVHLSQDNQFLKEKLREGEGKIVNMLKQIENMDCGINRNGEDINKIGKDLQVAIDLVKNINDVQLKNQQWTNAVSAINSRDDEKIIDDLRRQLEEEIAKVKKCQEDNAKLIEEAKLRDTHLKELRDLNTEIESDRRKLEAINNNLLNDNINLNNQLSTVPQQNIVKSNDKLEKHNLESTEQDIPENMQGSGHQQDLSKLDEAAISRVEDSVTDIKHSRQNYSAKPPSTKATKTPFRDTNGKEQKGIQQKHKVSTDHKLDAFNSKLSYGQPNVKAVIENDVTLNNFVYKKSASLKQNILNGRSFEKEFRKILDEFIFECSNCFCRLFNTKSKLYDICHRLCHSGIHTLSFRELAYLHNKIYAQADHLLPGCLLEMILADHKDQIEGMSLSVGMPHLGRRKNIGFKISDADKTSVDRKCCSCKNELCCSFSEEMIKEKVNKLEKDIGNAREYLKTLKNGSLEILPSATYRGNSSHSNNSTYRASSTAVMRQKPSLKAIKQN